MDGRGRAWLGLLGVLLCAARGAAGSEDWPCWRGAGRDGVVRGFTLPSVWPKELKPLWSVEVGEGHASPVVAGEKVFLLTRRGDQETVTCLDLSGHQVWQQQYPAPYEMNSASQSHGKGPKATPAVAGGRVFTLGISGILSAWSAESGQRLWQHDASAQFKKTSPLYGTALSPLANSRYCFAHVGGHEGGAFRAFEAASGRVLSSWEEDGPAYASPVLASFSGTWQLVTHTQTRCVGLTGNGELLWSLPFETEYVQNAVTPVVYKDTLILSGYNRGVFAYRVAKAGGRFQLDEVWNNDDVSFYMNTPVLVGDRLVGFSQYKRGQFVCLDARSGKTLWTGPGRQGDNAALLVADGLVIALTTAAELSFLDVGGEELRTLAHYRVAESATWAHPVVRGSRILVKDATRLSAWSPGET